MGTKGPGGTKVPRNFRSSGTKVLHIIGPYGPSVLGNERSWVRKVCNSENQLQAVNQFVNGPVIVQAVS